MPISDASEIILTTSKPSAGPVTVATTPRPIRTNRDGSPDKRSLAQRLGKRGGITETPQETKEEALRLIRSGIGVSASMDAIGVSRAEIYDWIKEDEDYAARFKIAREALAHSYASESVTLLDDGSAEDVVDPKRASAHVNLLNARSRARQWHASRILPQEYGEKIEHRGQVTHAVVLLPPLDPPTARVGTSTAPQLRGAAEDAEIVPG